MRIRLILLTLGLFIGSTAFAQRIHINKGDFNTTFNGNLSSGEFFVNGRFGTFIKDYFEVGADVGYFDSDLFTQYELGGYAIRFQETRTYTLPYYGIGLGTASIDGGGGSESGIVFSFILGVRYYVSSNVAINTEFRSAWSTEETFVDDDEVSDSDFRLSVGLTYLW